MLLPLGSFLIIGDQCLSPCLANLADMTTKASLNVGSLQKVPVSTFKLNSTSRDKENINPDIYECVLLSPFVDGHDNINMVTKSAFKRLTSYSTEKARPLSRLSHCINTSAKKSNSISPVSNLDNDPAERSQLYSVSLPLPCCNLSNKSSNHSNGNNCIGNNHSQDEENSKKHSNNCANKKKSYNYTEIDTGRGGSIKIARRIDKLSVSNNRYLKPALSSQSYKNNDINQRMHRNSTTIKAMHTTAPAYISRPINIFTGSLSTTVDSHEATLPVVDLSFELDTQIVPIIPEKTQEEKPKGISADVYINSNEKSINGSVTVSKQILNPINRISANHSPMYTVNKTTNNKHTTFIPLFVSRKPNNADSSFAPLTSTHPLNSMVTGKTTATLCSTTQSDIMFSKTQSTLRTTNCTPTGQSLPFSAIGHLLPSHPHSVSQHNTSIVVQQNNDNHGDRLCRSTIKLEGCATKSTFPFCSQSSASDNVNNNDNSLYALASVASKAQAVLTCPQLSSTKYGTNPIANRSLDASSGSNNDIACPPPIAMTTPMTYNNDQDSVVPTVINSQSIDSDNVPCYDVNMQSTSSLDALLCIATIARADLQLPGSRTIKDNHTKCSNTPQSQESTSVLSGQSNDMFSTFDLKNFNTSSNANFKNKEEAIPHPQSNSSEIFSSFLPWNGKKPTGLEYHGDKDNCNSGKHMETQKRCHSSPINNQSSVGNRTDGTFTQTESIVHQPNRARENVVIQLKASNNATATTTTATNITDDTPVKNNRSMTMDEVMLAGKPFRCTVKGCTAAYRQRGQLTLHLRNHRGEITHRPFPCLHAGCHVWFSNQSNLQVHMRIHTGYRPYQCTYAGCGMSFQRIYSLKIHLRRHTGEKPYPCRIQDCRSVFSTSAALSKHQLVHTGAKPYSCRFCDREFADKSNMKKHERNIHK